MDFTSKHISFLLKTLERVIDRHIRDGALKDKPLNDRPYAYQSVKSAELTLEDSNTTDSKKIAMTTF